MKENRQRMTNLKEFFDGVGTLVDAELGRLVPASGSGPQGLRDAMRWSLFAGGKRFRPALVLAVGRTLGTSDEKLMRAAAAIEMIHTYSLIHDDLPSMDDDDLRRGRETCHKKFGEAAAILAGDALQALAFRSLAEDEQISADAKVALVAGLARAAATMVEGQHLDLASEGKDLSLDEVKAIHESKTGALVSFSAKAGAVIAGVSEPVLEKVERFASKLGLLFQITDDLLDVTKTTEQLGKTAGKDIASEKATYPGKIGIEAARELARSVHDEAISILDGIGPETTLLRDVSDFLLGRQS